MTARLAALILASGAAGTEAFGVYERDGSGGLGDYVMGGNHGATGMAAFVVDLYGLKVLVAASQGVGRFVGRVVFR